MHYEIPALLNIVFRSGVVYLFMIVAFRVFGKRELTQLSIGDLVLIVLISNAVQNAMVGENTSLIGGLTAALVLFTMNLFLSYLIFRFKKVRDLIQSEPVTLIYNGGILKDNLNKVLLTENELYEALREHGVEKASEVSLALLEPDGNISIISGSDAHLKRTQHKRKRHHKTLVEI